MAESSPERSSRVAVHAPRAPHLLALLAAAALLAGTLPGGAPPMPVIPAESVLVTRRWRSSRQAIARVSTRVRRLARLLLAPREIAAAPTRRTANPVLPTVGRPRDGPVAA